MLQLMEVMGGVGGGRRGSRLLCYSASAVFAVVTRWRERFLVSVSSCKLARVVLWIFHQAYHLFRKYFVYFSTVEN